MRTSARRAIQGSNPREQSRRGGQKSNPAKQSKRAIQERSPGEEARRAIQESNPREQSRIGVQERRPGEQSRKEGVESRRGGKRPVLEPQQLCENKTPVARERRVGAPPFSSHSNFVFAKLLWLESCSFFASSWEPPLLDCSPGLLSWTPLLDCSLD